MLGLKDNFSKMPPQAIELEEVVLGAIMLEKDSVYTISNFLQPEDFYKDAHQKIYRSILSLSQRNNPIDILTVCEELKKTSQLEEVGGAYYIGGLTNKVASAFHLEYHAQIIKEKSIKRGLIRIASEINNKAFDDSADIEEILNYNSSELIKLTIGLGADVVKLSDAINEKLKEIEKIQSGKVEFNGIPTNLTKIDRITSGWQNTDLIILAARPSMGKTALALEFAKGAAIFNNPIVIFSLEMSVSQLSLRMISGETDYTNMELKNGRFSDWRPIEQGISRLNKLDFYIDDTPSITINQFKSRSFLYKQKYGIKLIIVDYLQLMRGSGSEKGNREQEISNISRTLKSIAKELDIPIIALSQLSRQVETRPGKRPILSDLRESGAIEQDADIVIFAYRPEYYGIMEDEEGNSTKGLAELIFAKHRNGSTCNTYVHYNEGMTKFYDSVPNQFTLSELKDNSISPDRNFETRKDDESPF